MMSASRVNAVPLSFAQERIWYLEQVGGGGTAYHMPYALRLRGELDVVALEHALNELRRRHDVLRTAIQVRGGEPKQLVTPFRWTPLRREDLATDGRAAEDAVRRRLEAEVRAPFDLVGGEPVRWLLLRVDRGEHVLLQSTHHIAFDGSSYDVLLGDMRELYEAFREGRAAALPPLPLTYRQYACAERETLSGERMERLLAFWREKLSNPPPALELPLDRPRPPLQGFRGAKVTAALDRRVFQSLASLGKEQKATPFMTVLAAVEVLLHRYCRQSDLAVATVVGGRSRKELEGLVGCFLNTVIVRTDLSGDPTFREAVARVGRATFASLVRQAAPFNRVVEEVRPNRSLSRTPLFQVLVRSESIGLDPAAHAPTGLAVEPVDVEHGGAYCDLDFSLRDDVPEPRIDLRYDTDLFERATAERMLDHLSTLMVAAAEDPDRRISELPLLGERERERLLVQWNDTAGAAPEAETLHGLVEVQASRAPELGAIEDEDDGALTLAELCRRADAVAAALGARGVGRGAVVGVLARRDRTLPVALLGVLKAGAAYLPLDPSYPAERLTFMAEDSAARLVVTSGDVGDSLPEPLRGCAVSVDELERCGHAVAAPPAVEARPGDPAYLIYTSGSTGRPKGVMVPHHAVVSFLRAMAERPGLAPGDRLLAVTTTSFDISVLELFLPLCTGGTVVIASPQTASQGPRLLDVIRRRGITVMQATPATWRMLADAGWDGEPGLRVLCGGEAMSPDLAAELLERADEVWNLYGPTEATVWCATHRVLQPEDPVPIGRPIANTRIYVLDEGLQPVPTGVVGQLWVGGAGVAIGYHDRPELNRERFVADPFAADPAARMYATGDLARWRPDGVLECYGRTDHQVKVRGFRIELGEVEAALESIPEVREAAASVGLDPVGERRLVAHVAYRDRRSLTTGEIRRRLRSFLPPYLVPSLVVEVDRLPRTPAGKIDRARLPAPLDSARSLREFEPPATPLERQLASIWADVIGLEAVGADDNFFDLGGHSLSCMRAVYRMSEATGRRFDPRSLMLQTLRQVAAEAEATT